MNGLSEHQDGESQKVKTRQGLGQTFIITSQSPKTSGPGERAFNHPALRQQDKAFLGFRQLDDDQVQASRYLSGVPAFVDLVYKGNLDGLTRDTLNLLDQFSDLDSLLLVGGGDMKSQQVAQDIDRRIDFATLFAGLPSGFFAPCDRSG